MAWGYRTDDSRLFSVSNIGWAGGRISGYVDPERAAAWGTGGILDAEGYRKPISIEMGRTDDAGYITKIIESYEFA